MSNGRRLDIGCAVFGKPQQLPKTVAAIQQHSVTDWRLFLIVNPHPTHDMREVVCGLADRDSRIVPVFMEENRGYSGAINEFFRRATSEYLIFVDDDATVMTNGWDETMCGYLDRFHELAMVFPNGGAYPINRGGYTEVLWGVGFCWALTRLAISDVGDFDESLGHQDEVDYQTRLRLAGYRIGAAVEVYVKHEATATNDPAAQERISRGVIRWVDKWVKYFGGKHMSYHSANVLRFEDWNVTQLYMEDWFRGKLPGLNDNPETVIIEGRPYDLIKVPRFKDFYKSRII